MKEREYESMRYEKQQVRQGWWGKVGIVGIAAGRSKEQDQG